MSEVRPNIDGFAALNQRLEQIERSMESQAVDPQMRQKILIDRAKALAVARVDDSHESFVVLAFRVGGERYAVPIDEVEEILEAKSICSLLGTPRHVLGAMVVRSRILPVLDLRQLLGLEGGGLSDLTKVVAVRSGDDVFGLAVEEVNGREELPHGTTKQAEGPFLCVSADRLAVLDLLRIGEPAPTA